MDFLDFEGQELYFDEALSPEVEQLLKQAAEAYPDEKAEVHLMRSYFLEPEHLTVLVALYRYYYYQHRYDKALMVVERTLKVAGGRLDFNADWHELSLPRIGCGVMVSMGLTRFYLLALKAAGYLKLRIGDAKGAAERLKKVMDLDPGNQFGARFLYELACMPQDATDPAAQHTDSDISFKNTG